MPTIPDKEGLTPTRRGALLAFAECLRRDSSPSIEEWARAMGVTFASAHRMRNCLIEAGLMTYRPGRVRSTRLTEKGARVVRRLQVERASG